MIHRVSVFAYYYWNVVDFYEARQAQTTNTTHVRILTKWKERLITNWENIYLPFCWILAKFPLTHYPTMMLSFVPFSVLLVFFLFAVSLYSCLSVPGTCWLFVCSFFYVPRPSSSLLVAHLESFFFQLLLINLFFSLLAPFSTERDFLFVFCTAPHNTQFSRHTKEKSAVCFSCSAFSSPHSSSRVNVNVRRVTHVFHEFFSSSFHVNLSSAPEFSLCTTALKDSVCFQSVIMLNFTYNFHSFNHTFHRSRNRA